MPFSQSDYNDTRVWSKMSVILNYTIDMPLNTQFTKLSTEQMTRYNQAMVEYIDQLPDEGYLEVIHEDFLIIVDSVKV